MKRNLFYMMIGICLLLIGCNKDETNEVNQMDSDEIDNPVVLTHDLEGGMEELIEGVLEYDSKTQCLFIQNPEEGDIAPVWTKGTTPYVKDGLHGVEIPDYGTVVEGDSITGGGGGVDKADIANSEIPESCIDKHPLFAITDLDK
ncbi:hypothetical protein ACFSKI_14530 [Pseudogracilibacillus auburnensis]|uniref:Uncharacterized protein n=1 Tax=Pseudogracilibacillus auburnensis TaxID=1494959 RepID=A0A2V3VPR7_9BACI|nr:hypothetical protein [Pseudogracilibacillus auburnensis]PXW83857.1 hypothetical protein DFR56_114142 [Pseudogracilibacillus auburnensis]